MPGLMDDLRLTLRQLRRRPLFTATAVVTLALGTGVTTALYTVVDGVVLAPLPFPAARRLVAVCETHASLAGFCVASPPNAAEWAARSRSLEVLGIGREWSFLLRTPQGAEGVAGGLATPELFAALGVRAALGRVFLPEDQAEGRAVALLSHDEWATRFGGDVAIVGRTVTLDGRPAEVIGVLPDGLRVPDLERVRVWTLLPFDPRDEGRRGWRGFLTFGRLRPGVTLADAARELGQIQQALGEAHPATTAGWGVRLQPLDARLTGAVRPTLFAFLGAAVLLLLVACANVASLLAARGSGRFREFAVRAAVGARPLRLVRLVATESLVLAVLGGATGLLVASWATDLFLALLPLTLPRAAEVGVDLRVLTVTGAVVLVTGMLSGLAPAWRAGRVNLADAIKTGQQPGASRAVMGLRSALVAAEVALAFALAAGAALLTRSYVRTAAWEPGFERAGLLTVWTLASTERYPDGSAVTALFERLAGELRGLPGVRQVGMVSNGPLFGGIEPGRFQTGGDTIAARWHDADPGYFATLGVPVVRGRGFAATDRAGSPRVALVNETMARRAWPGQDPVGRRLTYEDEAAPLEVVGVVRDVPPLTPGEATPPEVYWPFAQAPRWASYFVVRHDGAADALAPVIAARLRSVDADLSLSPVVPMMERLSRQLARPRFTVLLIGAFGLVALVLTAIGVFGVLAATVAARTRELGVRLALGAGTGSVVRMVVRQGLTPVLIGGAAGAVLAIAGARLVAGLLPGVRAWDPAGLGAAAVVLLGAALLGCWAPARRAGRTDPMTVLRAE